MKLKISCVSYVNTLPFVEGLRELAEKGEVDLFLDPPFRCSERLLSGEADVALLPSVELARNPAAVTAGSMGIASGDLVKSVLLISPMPFRQVRSIALDLNSRTSVALLQLLLKRTLKIEPELIPLPPEPDLMLGRCDAALLIGDPALRADTAGLHVLDMAQAWRALTGLPFVFAVWAGRDLETARMAGPLLAGALERGLELLPSALESSARDVGIAPERLGAYLDENIHFRLGPDDEKSLALFFRMCDEDELLKSAGRKAMRAAGQ